VVVLFVAWNVYVIAIRALALAIWTMHVSGVGLILTSFLPDNHGPQGDQYQYPNPSSENPRVELSGQESKSVFAEHLDCNETKQSAHENGEKLFREIVA
jgi:hypothetical protein